MSEARRDEFPAGICGEAGSGDLLEVRKTFLEGGFIFLKLVEVSTQPHHAGGAFSVLEKCPALPAGVLSVRSHPPCPAFVGTVSSGRSIGLGERFGLPQASYHL